MIQWQRWTWRLRRKLINGEVSAASVVEEAAKQSADLARQVLAKITDKTLHRGEVMAAVKILANETTADSLAFIQDELGADLKNLAVETWELNGDGNWRTLVDRDAEATANWALNLPEENKKQVLEGVLQLWSSSDEAGLASWIENQRVETAADRWCARNRARGSAPHRGQPIGRGRPVRRGGGHGGKPHRKNPKFDWSGPGVEHGPI